MDQTTNNGIIPPVQQTTPPTAPQHEMPEVEIHANETRQSSLGPVIGIVIVIILLIAGALYAWKSMPQNTLPTETIATEQADPQTEELMQVNTSTEPSDIEADLLNTNIDNLDADLGALLIESTQ